MSETTHPDGRIGEKPGSMEQVLGQHWHEVSDADVLALLGANRDVGLDAVEAGRRRDRFGANALTERKGQSPLVRFLLQLHQPLIYILLAAALVTAVLKAIVDAGVIFGVVLANAIVGFLQEAKALKAIDALAKSLISYATVLRCGRRERTSSRDLVPGDVIFLQSGDKVPADLRLIQIRSLQIDESALTGESLPSTKRLAFLPRETPLGDRANMAYSSTLVTYGTGTGVVVATGDATEIGRISELIASVETLETPLTRKIKKFSNVLLVAILILAGLAFVVGRLHGSSALEMFLAAVALTVGAIPEGLPAAVTIIMAAGVSRMAKRNAIIRRLPAVETLGSTTVICSDKTGTLTQNQMTVQEIFAAGESYTVTGPGYDPVGTIQRDGTTDGSEVGANAFPAVHQCLIAGLLCNDSEIGQTDGLWTVHGDPTEGALVSAAMKGGLRQEELARSHPRLDAIPFESEHQYMATLHDAGAGKPCEAYLKGSAESILPRCRAALGNAREESLDLDSIRRRIDEMAARGLRVLALASKTFPEHTATIDHADVADGLLFLGLQAMIDPPRPEAAAAIAACRRAGIQVKMITGDHAVTAAAIGRQIGILQREPESSGSASGERREDPPVLTSRDLEQLSDEGLIAAANQTAVFARVSPEHKLRLVEALQARGQVVAMTGDGVNDAPALRRADIGVAMALGGTEAAREAADMVLTDDNFASIQAAVEEGRGVFDNLQKFIVWTLPTNGGEGLVLLLAILLGITLPILPVQILWINMTTAITLGMMLAFEPKERGIMERPPIDPKAPLLSSLLVQRIILVSILLCAAVFGVFEWELARGASVAEARTAAVGAIVFGEMFYLFNCRSLSRSFVSVGIFSNPYIWVGVGSMTLLQALFTHAPAMNSLFHTRPLSIEAWALVIGAGLLVSTVVGLEKSVRQRRGRAGSVADSEMAGTA
jgi:Ca2+-transporting ATPase